MSPHASVVSRVSAIAAPIIRGAAAGLLDAILPPRCLACGAETAATGTLCAGCWVAVRFIAAPLCAHCGIPFEFEVADGTLCGACIAGDRPFRRVRAAIAYDDTSRGFILAFKNGDRTDAVRTFAPWMARAGRELIADADLLLPVPLHWTRLFARKYNQAALLAQALGRLGGPPVAVSVLTRHRRTRSLKHAGAGERTATVRGAFVVPERRRRLVAGRRMLLIDDVFTTGATVGACARALLHAGAASVDVLTLARVVRPATPAGTPGATAAGTRPHPAAIRRHSSPEEDPS